MKNQLRFKNRKNDTKQIYVLWLSLTRARVLEFSIYSIGMKIWQEQFFFYFEFGSALCNVILLLDYLIAASYLSCYFITCLRLVIFKLFVVFSQHLIVIENVIYWTEQKANRNKMKRQTKRLPQNVLTVSYDVCWLYLTKTIANTPFLRSFNK